MTFLNNNLDQIKFWEKQYEDGETRGPRWYQYLKPWVVDREETALRLLSHFIDGKKDILDIGCGEGNVSIFLAQIEHNVTGIDIAENRLAIARNRAIKKKLKNVKFIKSDLNQKLAFADNSFDVIISLGVIEYTFDPLFVLEEIRRLLKPGGLLIIAVPNIAYLPERVMLLFGGLPSWPDAIGWQGGRLHAFTMGSLARALQDKGYRVLKKTGAGFLHALRSWWASLLCGEILIVAQKTNSPYRKSSTQLKKRF